MTEFIADIRLVWAVVAGSLLLCALIVAGVKLCLLWFRRPFVEDTIKDYCSEEGYEYSKQDGIIRVKRRGFKFRIFLRVEPEVNITTVWIQFPMQCEDEFNNILWLSQPVLVNWLSDRHSSFNISMNIDDHTLWVHYRADIRSKKEFAYHFDYAVNETQSLLNDYRYLLPHLQEDFPLHEKTQQKSIGFA